MSHHDIVTLLHVLWYIFYFDDGQYTQNSRNAMICPQALVVQLLKESNGKSRTVVKTAFMILRQWREMPGHQIVYIYSISSLGIKTN